MGNFLDEIIPLAWEASRNFKETFKCFQKGTQQPLPATVPVAQVIRRVCGGRPVGPWPAPGRLQCLCSVPGLSVDSRWFLSRR